MSTSWSCPSRGNEPERRLAPPARSPQGGACPVDDFKREHRHQERFWVVSIALGQSLPELPGVSQNPDAPHLSYGVNGIRRFLAEPTQRDQCIEQRPVRRDPRDEGE